jgi:hypothetical protein
MTVEIKDSRLIIDDVTISLAWPVLAATDSGTKVFVLLNPDSYLASSKYKEGRRQGKSAIHNLIAVSRQGKKIWEAELPEAADYYYSFSSVFPLTVNSFSSFRCEIDPENGSIVRKEFFK